MMRASDFVDGAVLQTLGHCSVTVGVAADGTITLTAANKGTVATVTISDIPTCSGIVHVVDRPILEGPLPAGLEPPERKKDCQTIADVLRSEPELSATAMLLDYYDILPELDDAAEAVTYVGVNNAGIAVFGEANAATPTPNDTDRASVRPRACFACVVTGQRGTVAA